MRANFPMSADASTTEIVAAHNGVRELRRRWRTADPWADALIVHGAAEHSGRYEGIGARLSAAGIDTYAFDLQGCGASGGRRGDIDRWSTYLLQVRDNLTPILATGLPVLLLGHSVGGLIAVDYTLSGHPQPDLVVLHAPSLWPVVPAWQRKLAPLLARIVPLLTFDNRIDPTEVFSDPKMVELHYADPLATKRTTARLGAILLERMEEVGSSLDEYTARTLVVHGTADSLVLPSHTEPMGDLSSVDRKLYPGIKHGSVFERQGRVLVDDVIAWVREEITQGK